MCAATSEATPSSTTDANVAPWRSGQFVALSGTPWNSVAISGKARRLHRYLLVDASLALAEHTLPTDEGE